MTADVIAFPVRDWHLLDDVRDGNRALRATWHLEEGVVVLSVWRAGNCVATTRLAPDEAAKLAGVLLEGLAALANQAPQVAEPATEVLPAAASRGAAADTAITDSSLGVSDTVTNSEALDQLRDELGES